MVNNNVIAKEERLKQSQRNIRLLKDCRASLAMTFLFMLTACFSFSQTDTSQTRGTIKIGKPKDGKVYIKAEMNFDKYDLSKLNSFVDLNIIYPPFPGVEGYTFPFNYTRYFNEKFKDKEIDLRGKATDTVRMEVQILANGKIYIKDKTLAIYNKSVRGVERNRIQIDCLAFLKEIKTWEPAYVTVPKKDKFKNQTVIKPNITHLQAAGILTIVFSYVPFEE